MQRERLQLALERLRPEQWKMFEEFASAFLSSQYPDLRTVASSYGDLGRDGQLFSYGGKVRTVLQYSTQKDWTNKIRKTAKRISECLPDTKIMIYVTNQSILSAADSLRRELLEKYELVLDVHDISWFLDRLGGDEHRDIVSENLAKKIVDPYLESKGILEHSAPTLSTTESRAAFTFLQLQLEDDTREKGLTKLSFQALVRAVLRKTRSESRMSRTEIQDRIINIFPNHDSTRVRDLVDSALHKLTKRYIRHWAKQDEFCLTYPESCRIRERLAEIEISNSALDSEIQSTLQCLSDGTLEEIDLLGNLCRIVIDRHLFERGEAFAAAITNDRLNNIGVEELQKTICYVANSELGGYLPEHREKITQTVYATVMELLTEPSVNVQNHLRSKANAYTLFAFLGQTPDIQTAVSKMFSHGAIWLDTTIILPLLAEDLISNKQRRRFTQMLKVASSVGLDLRVTSGVIEETERHVNRCLTYVNMPHSQWSGLVPFLVDAYIRSGRSIASFASWIENFVGSERPMDDLIEYLQEFCNIEHENLEDEELKADTHLKSTIQEAWHTVHIKRRDTSNKDLDDNAVNRLVRHDVENYLGVVERRRRDGVSPLGYSAWWLTLDRSVVQVDRDIRAKLGHEAPPTPVMSADFLVNYLSIGPIRYKVTKEVELTLPISLDVGMFGELPPDLLIEADRIRQEAGDLAEHIIQRRVRDGLDAAKRRSGYLAKEGIKTVLDAVSLDAGCD